MNVCKICRHEKREEIEGLLALGTPLRSIALQAGVSHTSVKRHQTCVAALLRVLQRQKAVAAGESLMGRLRRYQIVAESELDNPEQKLYALDRCYKQIDIEAKLTGAYQEKQENQHDQKRKREVLIQVMSIYYDRKGEPKTREEIEREIDESASAVEELWFEAEQQAIAKGYIN